MERKKLFNAVIKTSPGQEQRDKDEAFLKLSPAERLAIHEELRRRIWRDRYNKITLKGMKVTKRPIHEFL